MNIDFSMKQAEFSAYIRDPDNNPPPADVDPKRMAMYRELFFNNIDSFLSANFPVLRSILDDKQWFELGQDFYAKHVCNSPHFSEIPEEFLDYLQNERDCRSDFPFILELAHYEWVEMALAIAKKTLPEIERNYENLQHRHLKLSPLAWPLAYRYPVHKIAPAFLPEAESDQATFLVVYRDVQDVVHFIEITPVTYRLLQIVQEYEETVDEGKGIVVEDCLNQLAVEMNLPNPASIFDAGLQMIRELADKTVIIVG